MFQIRFKTVVLQVYVYELKIKPMCEAIFTRRIIDQLDKKRKKINLKNPFF